MAARSERPPQVEETVCPSVPGPERHGAAQGTQRVPGSPPCLAKPALLPSPANPALARPGAHLWWGEGNGGLDGPLSLLLSVMGQRLAACSWRPEWWPHGSARRK